VRIIAGDLAGRRLAVPRNGARPTTDRVREAMFASIEHRLGGLAGLRVLDLFAGSGALALEALSRGADAATMVERDRSAVAVLRRNCADLGVADRVVVVCADAVRWRPAAGARFGLVLLDPPYDLPSAAAAGVLAALSSAGALDHRALIVVERSARSADPPWPPHWPAPRERRYGESAVWYGHAKEGGTEPEGI